MRLELRTVVIQAAIIANRLAFRVPEPHAGNNTPVLVRNR
jgi:hypothetical protein